MSYRLEADGYVVRVSDGATIPPDAGNADRQAFDLWVKEGNTPLPEIVKRTPLPGIQDQVMAIYRGGQEMENMRTILLERRGDLGLARVVRP